MINLGTFEYWVAYSISIDGFVNDEFNDFERWESYSSSSLIFNEIGASGFIPQIIII